MTHLLTWWYRISLPPKTEPDTSPEQREHTRYARLTSTFLLLVLVPFLPFVPVMIFVLPHTARLLAFILLGTLGVSWIFSRSGRQKLSAICIIAYNFIEATFPLVDNPLNPATVVAFSSLLIPTILGGALLPPVGALIIGLLASIEVACISAFLPHTAAYAEMIKSGDYGVFFIGLPIGVQMVAAVMIYVIMRSLVQSIRRADRAEEIADLRQELMKQAQERASEQEQLENGIEIIAQVHARIAKGDLNARVPLDADHVLWQIAVPLNNLLNRIKATNDKSLRFDQNKS